MNGNGKWCAQDKNKNKQKPYVHKKDVFDDIINKYLQKIYDQRRKLLILREEGIENYKAFKKAYTNYNNDLIAIDTSLVKNIPGLRMTRG